MHRGIYHRAGKLMPNECTNSEDHAICMRMCMFMCKNVSKRVGFRMERTELETASGEIRRQGTVHGQWSTGVRMVISVQVALADGTYHLNTWRVTCIY